MVLEGTLVGLATAAAPTWHSTCHVTHVHELHPGAGTGAAATTRHASSGHSSTPELAKYIASIKWAGSATHAMTMTGHTTTHAMSMVMAMVMAMAVATHASSGHATSHAATAKEHIEYGSRIDTAHAAHAATGSEPLIYITDIPSAIVALPFLSVAQDGISLSDIFEPLFSLLFFFLGGCLPFVGVPD